MAASFNRALWKRNLTRFWPIMVLCFITAFLVFAAPEIGRDGSSYYYAQGEREIVSVLLGYCASAVPVFSIFSALAVFGYLHNTRAANYISSLPITRRGLFITNYLSGLALTLIPHLIVGVIYGLALLGEPVSFTQYLTWFGIMIASHILFYSMAVFCAFLTGNPFVQVFLYALINFLYPLLYVIASLIASQFVYGYYGSLPFWGVLSPPIAMLSNLWPYYKFGNFGMAAIVWGCYLVFAAILIYGGYRLYKRRKIESAGDVIIHKPLRPVFKYAMAFLLGAFLGALLVGLTDGFNTSGVSLMTALAASAAFFGALSCLFLEMLIRKRLKVWRTAWKGIVIYICAVAVLAVFIRLDGTGFEHRVPDAGNVQAVSIMRWNQMDSYLLYGNGAVPDMGNDGSRYYISGNGWGFSEDYVDYQVRQRQPLITTEILSEIKQRNPEYFESPDGIAAALAVHRSIIGEKGNLESIYDGSKVPFVITYKMKDGSVITRRYNLPYSDEYSLESVNRLVELYNLPEAVDKRNRFLSLPEEELLGAVTMDVRPRYEDSYEHPSPYLTSEWYQGDTLSIRGDELKTLTSALRQDSGILGHINWREITHYDDYYSGQSSAYIRVSLCYDSSVVPTAFQPDSITDSEGRSIFGYVLYVPVSRDCTNTINALGELGFTMK